MAAGDLAIDPSPGIEKMTFDSNAIEIINYISSCKGDIHFKSQQRDEDDINIETKHEIASKIYQQSKSNFLQRFGKHLKPEHIEHFRQYISDASEGYEIAYYLKELTRYHDMELRKKDVRNRRFQAMQQMKINSSYFSEIEMMQRNPLLYEHLIGQYMTEEERKARDKIEPNEQYMFANILLEGYQREQTQKLKHSQEDFENEVIEETESDEEEYNISDNIETDYEDTKQQQKRWGEWDNLEDRRQDEVGNSIKTVKRDDGWFKVGLKERNLLKEEFQSHMFENFLDGLDTDFDYSQIDFNPTYDNIDVSTQDKEEKYFDSESPEEILPESEEKMEVIKNDEESEDELDVFMQHLKSNATVVELSHSMKNMET